MDIIAIRDRLTGLEQRKKDLRADSDLFLKAQGIDETLEKTRGEIEDLVDDAETYKTDLAELLAKKEKALAPTIQELFTRTTKLLPEGEAVFEIEDGTCFIGWDKGGNVTAYQGLSGGERVSFDGALCNALGAEIIIFESAEVDGKNMEAMLKMLAGIDAQVICNTWYNEVTVPKGFSVVEL